MTCSIGRAMEILGERWTFLILRESFYGVRRFSDIQRNLGIARNILSTRLQTLVGAGILERVLYQEEPERYEYRLSEAGKDLYPAIVTLMRWGDRHLSGELGPPVVLRHNRAATRPTRCSSARTAARSCDPHEVTPERGDSDVAAPDFRPTPPHGVPDEVHGAARTRDLALPAAGPLARRLGRRRRSRRRRARTDRAGTASGSAGSLEVRSTAAPSCLRSMVAGPAGTSMQAGPRDGH